MANGKELQDRAAKLLASCSAMTAAKRKQYEKQEGDVFKQTADICNAMFNAGFSATDVHAIMFCMKLARYGLQLNRRPIDRSERTIIDSILDANVYAALMEAERQLRNESQSEANTTE